MFKDRLHAGQLLSEALSHYKNDSNAVVLAIPRGGVEPGCIVSQQLNIPLELGLVKKIGHPISKECAIGAVSIDSIEITYESGCSPEYIERETARIRQRLQEQYNMYLGDKEPISLQGKTVIIVDDGVATGSTLILTLKIVRKSSPEKIVVAIPVGPSDVISKLKKLADEVVCLEVPADFRAVGQYYQQFTQVDDASVIELLKQAKR